MYRAIGMLGLLLCAMTAAGQQGVLTEDAAIRIGLSRSAVDMRTAGDVRQAEGDLLSARTRPNPELSYERESLNNADDQVEHTLQLSQRFDVAGRRALQIRAADRHLEAAQYGTRAWRAELKRQIRERYFTTLYQQKRRTAYARTREDIRLLSNTLDRRRREGDVVLYDFQRVRSERAALKAEVSDTDVAFDSAWQRLMALLGGEAQGYAALAGKLVPEQTVPQTRLADALEAHPKLQRLRTQADAYALQRQAENRSLPDVTVGLGVRREDSDRGADNGLVLSASMPLPVFDRRQAGQARSHAREMLARSEYALARDEAMADLQRLWTRVTHYRDSAREFRAEAVQAAAELIEVAQAYYRAGEIGILELLDAYRGALEAELTALELEYKARLAHIELDYLTGGAEQ
ncbi:uncharacterized protein FOKN1_1315 [Thiohalobacter thiocyanaticus]|uniref:TolC family protein n=1 Tax=Thiohalobacter thiocyanaticus TaxID=585455 RepID=A0A1Z4VQF2_9GAMM|nr:TolC family protein [Thiohalobacter thiocyanaticus]BAZ93713.1 uncharacterized protein FOKN1_1315 [Thiohalobacter thiocyanaticus]